MMKVLQIVADGAPGGGTNHVLQLLRGLSDGCELILMTQRDSYLHREAEKLGTRVVTGDFFRSRVDASAIRLIGDTIRKYRPHLVHCHGGRAAFFRCLLRDATPSIYTVHGFHFARKTWFAKLAGWLGEYWSIRRMQQIIFVSEFDRNLATRFRLLPSTKPYRVIHNGIAVPEVSSRDSDKRLGVGFVGRMVYQKNPQLFVDVLDRLPGVDAVMVGGGDLEADVAELIDARGLTDRVKLCGSLDHKETLNILSKLDVMLMTPRWEGLPLLPLEAMFLKVPVVSTSAGGIPEVIEHGRTGMLATCEDADELAAHVHTLLQNRSLRNRIVNDAAQDAQARFGEKVMLRRLREIYQSLEADYAETSEFIDYSGSPFRNNREAMTSPA